MTSVIYLRHFAKATRITTLCQTGNIFKISLPLGSPSLTVVNSVRYRSTKKKKLSKKDLNSIVVPVQIAPESNADGIDAGSDLAGAIDKTELINVLSEFSRGQEIRILSAQHGLDDKLFPKVSLSFRRYCLESKNLPIELHIVLSDVLCGAGHVHNIFPYFLGHAKFMFPHLDCKEDLHKISDLRLPPNWYGEARSLSRKIIFHAGPTNSGKTYHALNRLFDADSGVYCGPLRMLANEVYSKAKLAGTECDLVTGEERKLARADGEPASHVSCTLEMASVTTPYEVAVIDEIQMLKDQKRGWAWTRALLGVCAKEVHLCGEPSAIDMVKEIMLDTGDELEVRNYKRLTKLTVLDKAVEKFTKILPGDCIVCFNKNDIYDVARKLKKLDVEVAVIYGTLPPGTKLAQADRFNDPDHPCKVMVATDAVGMGLNLVSQIKHTPPPKWCILAVVSRRNIKRLVFYSLIKPNMNDQGQMQMEVISPSSALQIAGRAGRYGTDYDHGYVTTFKENDLPLLKKLLDTEVVPVEQAGLHPTTEQIELFSYHLPKATLSNILDIFRTVCQVDNEKYFLCDIEDFKLLADMIDHIELPLRSRYVFCCAPISTKQPFVSATFIKFARQFSRNQPITLDWLCKNIEWPFKPPMTIAELTHLEGVFDIMDTYLWLSYRFHDMFPDTEHVRDMQFELDHVIRTGVQNIVKLLINTDSGAIAGSENNSFSRKNSIDMRVDNNKEKNIQYNNTQTEERKGGSVRGFKRNQVAKHSGQNRHKRSTSTEDVKADDINTVSNGHQDQRKKSLKDLEEDASTSKGTVKSMLKILVKNKHKK